MAATPKLSSGNQLRQLFSRLTIRQKIICGSAISLGIAVLGITVGLAIGQQYFQQARQQMELADEEGSLLSDLQGELLEIQIHQQEIQRLLQQLPALRKQIIYFSRDIKEAETLVKQLQDFSQTNSQKDLQILLQSHKPILAKYFKEIQQLQEQISSLISQTQGEIETQQLLSQFAQSPTSLEFYHFAHKLTEFAQTVRERQELADEAQNQAAFMQAQIIIASILLSLALAAILAWYISNIIAQPINAVTNIAQQVTQQADFDLQAPITTKDEIGVLANSLNELIKQVKYLLVTQQEQAQARLIQAEKMSSLGRMLAGVAHEINNPVNFISGNLSHAKTYIDDLLTLVQTYNAEISQPPENVQALATEIDFDFLREDLPKLINSMTLGVERTKEIVRSLKDFSRLDEGSSQLVDLHACIESTLLILNNRLKKGVTVIRNYGDIPLVPGYTSLLYQVFMNLLSNALDALEDKSNQNSANAPQITIITERNENYQILVRILDNGVGIALENQPKIFESFFTTKPRDVGTGLGLAITHQIVVEKHQGTITCKSGLNQGTEFTIALPIHL